MERAVLVCVREFFDMPQLLSRTASGRAFVSITVPRARANADSSELFSHTKGAFARATQRRRGRFELADGAPSSGRSR